MYQRYGPEIEHALRKYVSEGLPEEFRDEFLYFIETGGKRLRPMITLLFAEATGGDWRTAIPAAAAVELIHNYSLIFDDIIDRADVRRGKPTVRKAFGDSAAILIGIWYREAIERALLDTPDPPRFAAMASEAIRAIDIGELYDILMERAGRSDPLFISKRLRQVTLEKYFEMVRLKTGALMGLAAAFGAASSGAPNRLVETARRFGEYLGIAFQIVDDVLDIFGKEDEFGKEIGKDIKEHKLGNIVLLLGYERLGKSVLDILSREVIGAEEVRKLIDELRLSGVREEAMRYAQEFAEKALSELSNLPDSWARDALAELTKFVLVRER